MSILKSSISSSEVLDRAKQALNLSSDASLSEYLNVGRTNISTWRKRNTVPYEQLYLLSKEKNIDLDWIILGEEKKDHNQFKEPDSPKYSTEKPDKKPTIKEVGLRLRASKEAYRNAVKQVGCRPSNYFEEILQAMLFKGVINQEGLVYLLKELQDNGDHLYIEKKK